jgi:hypothetical protein
MIAKVCLIRKFNFFIVSNILVQYRARVMLVPRFRLLH